MTHTSSPNPHRVQQLLLAHFAKHKRDLPWRHNRTPYRVWLAEVMLQQTTVQTVIPYFERFTKTYPTAAKLAAAPLDDVLKLWEGLGYYSRARNLHACAQTVVADYAGDFPTTAAELIKLPGIGPYTAAAVAAIAFDEPSTVVDGNVERVISRLFNVQAPLPTSKPKLHELTSTLTPKNQPGDFAEAMMDLGATICTPKNPRCDLCPLFSQCAVAGTETASELPRKLLKPKQPHKTGAAFIIQDPAGRVYLQQRPATGLLAKMWGIPSTGWEKTDSLNTAPAAIAAACCQAQTGKQKPTGQVKHVFTHFKLTLDIYVINWPEEQKNWHEVNNLPAIPKLFQKALNI